MSHRNHFIALTFISFILKYERSAALANFTTSSDLATDAQFRKVFDGAAHLFDFRNVLVNEVAGLLRVPLLHVLLHFDLQEALDLPVVGEDCLVRAWQVLE